MAELTAGYVAGVIALGIVVGEFLRHALSMLQRRSTARLTESSCKPSYGVQTQSPSFSLVSFVIVRRLPRGRSQAIDAG